MTIRFGIIGCGMIADFHSRALAEVPDAELVACVSRSQESATRFAGQHGCTAYDTIDSMLSDSRLDAVTICSPSGAHLDSALAAARSGKHVVIEKPLEVTLDRCDRIIEACEQEKVVLSTIFQSRFHESSRLLKAAIEAGRFGQITLANAYVKWFRTQEYYDSGAWRGTWELDGGGALMNQAIHNIDLLQWMMGPVRQVSAFVATLAHEQIEVEDTAVASLRFSNGALGTIEATTSAWPGSSKRLEIYGSRGSAIIEDEDIRKWEFADSLPDDQDILHRFSAKNETTGGGSDPSAIDYEGHLKQYIDIVDAIRNGTRPLIDGGEARKSVEIVNAIYRSARDGQIVRIDS